MLNEEQKQLAVDNQRLVTLVIKKLRLVSEYWDFYDIGMIGLMKGCKNFDKELGYKPSTYLQMCIRNEILIELRKRNQSNHKANYTAVSIDKEMFNNLTLKDIIASDFSVEDEIFKEDKLELVLENMKYLSDNERFVINHTYELSGCKKLNQEEMSRYLEVTQAQVSRIKRNAIRKLRRNLMLEEQMV